MSNPKVLQVQLFQNLSNSHLRINASKVTFGNKTVEEVLKFHPDSYL